MVAVLTCLAHRRLQLRQPEDVVGRVFPFSDALGIPLALCLKIGSGQPTSRKLKHLRGSLARKEDAHEGYEEVVHGCFAKSNQAAPIPKTASVR